MWLSRRPTSRSRRSSATSICCCATDALSKRSARASCASTPPDQRQRRRRWRHLTRALKPSSSCRAWHYSNFLYCRCSQWTNGAGRVSRAFGVYPGRETHARNGRDIPSLPLRTRASRERVLVSRPGERGLRSLGRERSHAQPVGAVGDARDRAAPAACLEACPRPAQALCAGDRRDALSGRGDPRGGLRSDDSRLRAPRHADRRRDTRVRLRAVPWLQDVRAADAPRGDTAGGLRALRRHHARAARERVSMLFKQIPHDDLGCASYLIGDEKAGVAAVVDPRFEIDEYLEWARYRSVNIA